MRWTLLALGAALAAPAAAQQLEVTLDEAVRRALQVQPAMVQARGEQRTAGATVLASTGAFLPSVTAGGSSTRAGGTRFNAATNQIVTSPANTTFSGSLQASLTLFDGLQRFADRRSAVASLDAADAGVVNQRFQVTLATKQVFYDALAREELLRVADAQVRRAEQQLQISVEKLRAGSATRSDSLRSTVDLGNARIALLQARANLATAQANLGRQVGVDAPVRAVADTALPVFPDTAGLAAAAHAAAPAVQRAEAQARAAQARVAASRASYMPTLSVSASTGATGPEAPWQGTDSYGTTWQWRFSVNWSLFNGFAREQQYSAARVARDNAEATAADARRQVNAQLTQQLAALATAFEQIDIAAANLAAAREDLRVQQERYRVGAATILDLLTSQASLTQAESNVVSTRFNYFIARAQLEALVGRVL
jgi:outer membrane protein TolC